MKIEATTKDAYQLFHEGTYALARAERVGFRFDIDIANKHKADLTTQIEELEKKIENSDFFKHWQSTTRQPVNINSPDQLGKHLYGTLGLKPPKLTKTNKGSTDVQSLEKLNIPEIGFLLEIRKLKKIRDTYLGSFFREQANGVIHPSYSLSFPITFRSSCSNPNLQNIPVREEQAKFITRSCLFPRKGHQLLEVDYGQLEVRISACYNNDQKLIYDILHGDMHTDMAKELFMIDDFDRSIDGHSTLRNASKNGFVFPEFYGSYYKNCAESLVCQWGGLSNDSNWRAKQGIEVEPGYYLSDHLRAKGFKNLHQYTQHVEHVEDMFWNERYKTYTQWKKDWYAKYQRTGYVDLKTGFRCIGVMSENDSINYPIQGAAFHCMLWSFIQIDKQLRKRRFKTRIIGQIHDSIILDVHPKELDEVAALVYDVTVNQLPKHWDWITVPLEVDADIGEVDAPWYSLQSFKNFGGV